MEYLELLKRAKEQAPERLQEKERFELPTVKGHIEGNKTIISNYSLIAEKIRRPQDHLLKYLLKELATPGMLKNGSIVFGTKVAASRINQKIKEYADEFVFCGACGKPDTDIKKDGKLSAVVCSVCGHRTVVTSKL